MTDIVERLRAKHLQDVGLSSLGSDAADEIERLRNMTPDQIKDDIIASHVDAFMKQEAEIERLVNEVNGYKHDVRRLLEGEDYLRYEIKRLQKTRRGLEEQQIEDRAEIGRLQTLVKKLGMPGF